MRRLAVFVFLLSLLLSACNMKAATPAAMRQPEAAPELPTAQPTQTPALAFTSTLEVPSPQAAELEYFPTSTPLPPPQTVPSSEIKFAAGGTWKDTQGSIPSGGFKTYTLSAMQGQVMSVSITGGYFPLRIEGRDGTLLCPVDANSQCDFWRGTLPLSQDYYITVISGGMEEDFELRVAINPKGKAEQFFSYTAANASLSYSDSFAPARTLSMLNTKTTPQLSLQLIDTSSYINTNLGEAYFTFGSSADPTIVSACTEPNQNGMPETPAGKVNANGYTFAYSTVFDVGAGNYYEQHIYRAFYNAACYEVIYFIHSSNIQNYAPGAVKEFDRQGLLDKFNKMLASIQLK